MIIDNNVIKQYKGTDKSVTIPKGVRRIDDFAFENSPIEEIKFDDSSLKIVGEYAFRNSALIKEILLPDSVISIGTGAFKGCTSLERLFIPPSVLDIDGEILSDGCKTIIIGESNSSAEEYANSRNILFKVGYRSSLQSGIKEENNPTTIIFNIFGVKVNCSKGFPVFLANKKYYEGEKAKLYNSVLAMLPSSTKANSKYDKELIYKQCDTTVNRLKSHKIVVTRDQVLNMVADSVLSIFQILGKYYELATDVKNGLNTDITNMRNELDAEAARKITGVNYGVIGGPLDMVLYSLDNAIAARRQYNRAVSEAQALDNQYTNQLTSKADRIIASLYKEVQPLVKDAVNSFADALCYAENRILSDSELMDLDSINNVDEAKSSKFFSSIKSNDEDADYKIGLALKNNPYNIALYKRAFELGLVSSDLLQMISFLGLDKELKEEIDDYFYEKIRSCSSVKECIKLLFDNKELMSNQVQKYLLSSVTTNIADAKKEFLSRNIASDAGTREYCEGSLKSVVEKEPYTELYTYCNSDRELSALALPTYNELVNDWIKTREKIEKAYGEYDVISSVAYWHVDEEIEYKEIKSILNSNEENAVDTRELIVRLEKLKNYKDSSELLDYVNNLRFDKEYLDCINRIEEATTLEEFNDIINRLSGMKHYKESDLYISKAEEKRLIIEKTLEKEELRLLQEQFEEARSDIEYEEIERALRRNINNRDYADLLRQVTLKKNAKLREKAESALSVATSKEDYVAIRTMLIPRSDEPGIKDLFLQVIGKINEIEAAEACIQIMEQAESANSVEDYTDIIRSLALMLMYGKEASNRKQEIDRQHYTIPNQRPKDKHCGKI